MARIEVMKDGYWVKMINGPRV
ncbi:uncharacterized protein G2W53_036561 [Senna tora]|uniref:Uncharacterized protein n=1 Tax=Senna tora TaxID=362788 RepID=A0A834SUM1_9FABA|nr:uncharacterized protein G2W53_036561 [Senna tora]